MKKFLSLLTVFSMMLTMLGAALPASAATAPDLSTLISNTSSGGTVTLTSDVTVSTHLKVEKSVTIDGNHNTYTVSANYTPFILNVSGITVTVKNLTVDLGSDGSADQPFVQIRHGSTLNFENCTFITTGTRSNSYFNFNNGGGTLNMIDCDIQIRSSAATAAIFGFLSAGDAASVTLENVTANLTESAPLMSAFNLTNGNAVTLAGSTAIKVGGTVFQGNGYTAEIKDQASVAGGTFMSGTDITVKGYGAPVMLSGAQMRVASTQNAQNGLRFQAVMSEESATVADSYGIILAKWQDVKTAGDLTREALDAVGVPYQMLAAGEHDGAGLTYDADSQSYTYSMALVNIPEEEQTTDFAARAYAVYGETVVYSTFSERHNVRNLCEVANAAYTDVLYASAGEYGEKVREDGVNSYYSPYTKAQYDVITAYASADYKAKYATVATVTGSSADRATWVYQETQNGVMIREQVLDLGLAEALEIAQISDIHFTSTTANDNTTVAYTAASSVANFRLTVDNHIGSVMEYANQADQIVLTGDMFTYLCADTIAKAKRYVWNETYIGKIMACLGNHDVIQSMNLTSNPETLTLEDRMALLGKDGSWVVSTGKTAGGGYDNSIYYSSKLLGADQKVMLIQMDNASLYDTTNNGVKTYGSFANIDAACLEADLDYARDNGCTVLLFYHVPLNTGNTNDASVAAHFIGDSNSSVRNFYNGSAYVGAGDAVYDLITANADIIAGAFCGHEHSDFYTEILGTKDAVGCVIPQYIVTGAAYNSGHLLKITIQ